MNTAWGFGKAWHAKDIPGNGHDHTGSVIDDQVMYVHFEIVCNPVSFGILEKENCVLAMQTG